jgi:hypothetical protein
MFGFIKRLSREFRDPYTLKVLFVTYVRSKLEYANCGNLFMSLIWIESKEYRKTWISTWISTLWKPLQSSGDGYTEEEERCRSCPVGFWYCGGYCGVDGFRLFPETSTDTRNWTDCSKLCFLELEHSLSVRHKSLSQFFCINKILSRSLEPIFKLWF